MHQMGEGGVTRIGDMYTKMPLLSEKHNKKETTFNKQTN